MPEKELPRTVSRPVFNTYALTVCALLTALSVVLARVLTLIPAETTRISLEAVPIVLSGLLFGPIPGAVVGFARRSHRLPVLPLRLQSHFLRAPHPVRPAGRCGTAVCDGPASPAPHGAGLLPRGHRGLRPVAEHGAGSGVRRRCQAGIFLAKLVSRSIQFALTGTVDTLIVWLLLRRGALNAVQRRIQVKGGAEHDHQ